jgi:hypothetical protein
VGSQTVTTSKHCLCSLESSFYVNSSPSPPASSCPTPVLFLWQPCITCSSLALLYLCGMHKRLSS